MEHPDITRAVTYGEEAPGCGCDYCKKPFMHDQTVFLFFGDAICASCFLEQCKENLTEEEMAKTMAGLMDVGTIGSAQYAEVLRDDWPV